MRLNRRYSELLLAHVQAPAEAHLAAAAELGRELVLEGVPPEEIAEFQQDALDWLLGQLPELTLSQVLQPMSAIQSEMMMAYGLVFREQLAERHRVEAQILAALREKEVLLAEIHHRVKNNLQIMSSLFSLQTRFTHEPQAQRILRDSQSRIRAMALIHEKLYASRDFEQIDFADYLQGLCHYLQQLYGAGLGVRLRLAAEPARLPMDTVIPLGILVTELVSNALKHAFPDGRQGDIVVGFRRVGETAELSVSDDGIGLEQLPDLRKPGSSLGWHLIRTLTAQLKGEVAVSSGAAGRKGKKSAPPGTRVSIRFPTKSEIGEAS